jgi:mannose-1-phosphate guanylyltransferase
MKNVGKMNCQIEFDKPWTSEHRWGLILAGGEGKRLQPFIGKLYGTERAKQYCSIVGTRSMLQHTLDRIKLLIPFRQILTVIDRNHLERVQEQLIDQPLETIIVQPCRRETAIGILLPLLHIYHQDPQAHVAIFPSDQFISEEKAFMECVAHAFRFINHDPNRIVLLGIHPSGVELEYGWIEKSELINETGNMKIHRVGRFWEKPDRMTAEELFNKGCLWNTLVMVGTVSTLLSQFEKFIPGVFDQLYHTISLYNPIEREYILNEIYPSLPSINFSEAILEKCTDQLCVLEVSDIYWSDWGSEFRILRDVERLKLKLHDYELPGLLPANLPVI